MSRSVTPKHADLPSESSFLVRSKLPSGTIHWSEAKEHIGEHVRVYGEVASTYFDWDEYERWVGIPEAGVAPPPTFLEIGASYPSKELLKVVIWGRDREKFSRPPDEQFRGATIMLAGKPYLYRGLVYIQVSDPKDIVEVAPIEGLYVECLSPAIDELESGNQRVFSQDCDRFDEGGRAHDDWRDPELYGHRNVTYDEWGEEVELVSIPGTYSTMYFDEDNGWIVD